MNPVIVEPTRSSEPSGVKKIALLIVLLMLYACGFDYLIVAILLGVPILWIERSLDMRGPLTWLIRRN